MRRSAESWWGSSALGSAAGSAAAAEEEGPAEGPRGGCFTCCVCFPWRLISLSRTSVGRGLGLRERRSKPRRTGLVAAPGRGLRVLAVRVSDLPQLLDQFRRRWHPPAPEAHLCAGRGGAARVSVSHGARGDVLRRAGRWLRAVAGCLSVGRQGVWPRARTDWDRAGEDTDVVTRFPPEFRLSRCRHTRYFSAMTRRRLSVRAKRGRSYSRRL